MNKKQNNRTWIIIGLAVAGLALSSTSEAGADIDNNQRRYLWQLEEYRGLRRQFREAFKENLRPKTPPSTEKELYLWQLEDYKNLREKFHATFDRDAKPQTIPETNDELYLWQLEEYSRIRKVFSGPIAKNFAKEEKPFTP
jgi:hypothetical protein